MKKNKPFREYLCHSLKKISLIMRIAVILLLVGFLQTHANDAYSQKTKLSIDFSNAKLVEVLDQIENKSEFFFLYNEKLIDTNQKVSITAKDQGIEDVLKSLFKDTDVSYSIIDRKIILTPLNNSSMSQQQKSVSGKVTDSSGSSLPGVSVVVKGTTNGTITDANGKYSIQGLPANAILQFSFVGMKTQEIAVGDKPTINVTLAEETVGIDEVVAIGYGTQKKVNLTGSVVTVSAKQIETRPTTGMLKSLQGTVTGVTIIDRPGGSPEITIRGQGSFAGGSAPLYILDGLEISGSFFNSLDPNMIENITVLKDASSAAIYGAKAAYGVILVTTKRGGNAKNNSISYSGGVGVQAPTYIPKVVDSGTYAEQYRRAELNTDPARTAFKFSLDDINKYKSGSNPDLYPSTNWFDLILQNSLYTHHNLQFVGGSDKASYLLSTGYQSNEDFYPGRETKKYNFLAKSGFEVNNWVKINSSVNLIISNFDRTTGNIDSRNLTSNPTITAKQSDGNWGSIYEMAEINPNRLQLNQLRQLNEGGRGNSITKRLLGNINLELTPFKGFKFTNMVGYNYFDSWNFDFLNSMNAVPSFLNPGKLLGGSPDNQMTQGSTYSDKIIFDSWVNYGSKFREAHTLSVMAGFHAESSRYKNLSLVKKNFLSNDFNALNGGSNDPADIVMSGTNGSFTEETQESVFARVGYNYREKYIFEANFRADGSSRFATNKKWGYYPSLSLGWRLSEENFVKGLSWITNLKLRGSWGESGNINNVGLYDTYDTYSVGTIYLGGANLPMLQEANIGNKDLTWENTTTANIGLDFAFLGGKIDGAFELFDRTTNDILVQQTDVFVETGIDKSKLPYKNVGSLYNKGFELAINHTNKVGQFEYSLGGNITYIKNRITSLGEGINNLPPSTGYAYTINMVGESINSYYMYKADGLYSPEEIAGGKYPKLGSTKIGAGMIKYINQVDVAGGRVNEITADDRVVCGDNMPDYTYGLNFSISYKGLTLSAFGQGVMGSQVYLDLAGIDYFSNGGTIREWQINNWTETNQNAMFPKLFLPSDARYVYNYKYSSYWLFDADYFRLKNLKLNYSIPDGLLKKMKFKKLDIFIEGENLATMRADKRMKDFDPERGVGAGNFFGMKTYSVGLNLTF